MNNDDHIPVFIVGIIFLVACFVGGCVSTDYWQAEIIKHGNAQHNPITGKWEWKEENSKEDHR